MRVPLGVNLESRDGTVSKDAKVMNGLIEAKGDAPIVRKRPGVTDLGSVHSGTAQLLYAWNGINTVQGDYLNSGTISTIISGPTSTNLGPTNAGLQFSAQETGSDAATQRLMIKNRTQAWSVTKSGAISSITLPAGLGSSTYSVTSITRSGGTATVTLAATDASIDVGDSVTIAGAVEGAYNGAQTVLAVTPYSYTPSRDITISSLTRSGTTATAVATAHGLTTATAYTISGANESAYNGSKTITVVDADTFTYTMSVTTFSAITGTWNPADKAAAVTLSGGNLTASSNPAVGNYANVRGTVSKAAGQWAFEVTVGTIGTSSGDSAIQIGIATSTQSLTGTLTGSANAWVYYGENGGAGALYSGSTVISVASLSAGDKVGVAFDGDADTVSFYKNGTYQGGFTGVSGTVYPVFGSVDFSGAGAVTCTANFAGAFTYSYDSPATAATGSPIVTAPAVTVPMSFTYTVAGSPATPATGTITASTSAGMVPGIAYINGYFCVMDTNGVIWSSASDDPTTWGALDFITAQNENGAGKAIAKSQNYLIAFKSWSTEFFYDAANAVGSPFSPVDNGFTQVGCASGDSVVSLEGGLIWLSQTKQLGRGVHRMVGLDQSKVSTPDVERILNADDLAIVRAFPVTLDGHSLYVLTLETSNITLVYDATSGQWYQWSSLTLGSSKSISSITLGSDGVTATVNFAVPHTLNDGDPMKISGATQGGYNGIFQASYVDSDTVEIQVSGGPASPATGTIVGYPYTESYFKFTKAANLNGTNLLLHESNGHLYQMSPSTHQDAGIPIDLFIRTVRMDGGTNEKKKLPSVVVIADKVSDALMVRHSDDDCQTFAAYRIVDLDNEKPQIRRCGVFRRRTIELRHIGNTAPQLQALEMEIPQ
jgi:hypothetical protein